MTNEARWLDSMTEAYDQFLGPVLFEPFARHLAQAAARFQPAQVLEVAAGTGIATRNLLDALPGVHLVATDMNPAMVGWASARVPGASWSQANAQELDFADASFDLVVCQFGAMFFPDKPRAFAEIRRVLRPGGIFLFSVWDEIAKSPFPKALTESVQELLPENTPDFLSRIPHGYFDAEVIASDVAGGGLVLDSIEPVVLVGHSPSAAALAEGFCFGTPLRFALEQRGSLAELAEAVSTKMTERLGDGPVTAANAAYLVTATRS